MSDSLHEKLNAEITRKQFLQYLGTALLMIFGLNNLVSLLTGHRFGVSYAPRPTDGSRGFGSSKFGV